VLQFLIPPPSQHHSREAPEVDRLETRIYNITPENRLYKSISTNQNGYYSKPVTRKTNIA